MKKKQNNTIANSKEEEFKKYFSACIKIKCDTLEDLLGITHEEGDKLAENNHILIIEEDDGCEFYVNPKLDTSREQFEVFNLLSDAHNYYAKMAELCNRCKEANLIERDCDGFEYLDVNYEEHDFSIRPYVFGMENQDRYASILFASMVHSLESRLNKRLDEINDKLDRILFNTDK